MYSILFDSAVSLVCFYCIIYCSSVYCIVLSVFKLIVICTAAMTGPHTKDFHTSFTCKCSNDNESEFSNSTEKTEKK